MIDVLTALSFSVYSGKGVYALLLGSGVSRSAEIPTGWEVTLDLIRKLAKMKGQNCKPDPEAWYNSTYGRDADYAKILEEIGRTPADRNAILRSYCEPSRVDREAGYKLPT